MIGLQDLIDHMTKVIKQIVPDATEKQILQLISYNSKIMKKVLVKNCLDCPASYLKNDMQDPESTLDCGINKAYNTHSTPKYHSQINAHC